MPLFTGRTFNLYTKRTNGPLGTNKRYSNEEIVTAEIGQVGTQLDMFSHQGIDGLFYNCVKIDEIATRTGFSKLGVDKIGALFARGVLIDARQRGGDARWITRHAWRTRGRARTRARDAQRRRRGAHSHRLGPAVGRGQREVCDRLARHRRRRRRVACEKGRALIGADTGPVEILPNPDKQLDLPCASDSARRERHLPAREPEARRVGGKQVYEFALLVEPLKIEGGTGSTVAPIAIH